MRSRKALAVLALVLLGSADASAADLLAKPGKRPLAGYKNGVFFLRDETDTFRIYPQGRIHLDGIAWLGPGSDAQKPSAPLNPTIFVRRARAEMSGELAKLQFTFQLELASTAIATTAVKPALVNAFVNYPFDRMLNVQAGQFRVPFSFENRTSVNFLPFHERSLPVRVVSAPTGREVGAMLWGETPAHEVYYSLGAFSGDGSERTNADRRFDVVGRTMIHPFGKLRPLRDIHVGFSGRGGSRDPRLVGYDVSAMTTQGGYSFFRTTYEDSSKKTLHIVPSDLQRAAGLELFVPYRKVDVVAEYIAMANDTREDRDTPDVADGSARKGRLSGHGAYVQLGLWVIGDRTILPRPGYMVPMHGDLDRDAPSPPSRALALLLRVEQLRLRYEASSRAGSDDAKTPSGDIRVDGLGFAANYWMTRHVRASADYLYYTFQDRALSPAARAGVPGSTLHELSVRLGAQF